MPTSAWGDAVTRLFFELTPERVLHAMEAAGYACTGLCYPLASYENRVYEVEIREDAARGIVKKDVSSLRRVVKFYRPGRWSREQIQEEHDFLWDLTEEEIPVVAPLAFEGGATIAQTPGVEGDLWYTIFPRVGGRSPDDLTQEQLERLGRLLARIHNVGAAKEAKFRIPLTPETYGLANLEFLLSKGWLPPDVAKPYEQSAREICRIAEDLFQGVRMQRIHGDCHPGNLLWSDRGPFFVDFDDMVRGPAVQDVWLLLLRQDDALQSREILLEAYESMRAFDRTTLRLIEPLRALRFIHFTAWLARRWNDPAFPRAFPHFNTPRYWQDVTHDLREQLAQIREATG